MRTSITKNILSQKKTYIILFLIAFAIALSSTYNPFNFRRMHVDSSVYITVTQGIIRGELPYRNFVDNKGPFAYFLSLPGLYFGGFTGIWITEIIMLFVSILFAYKTALFFGNSSKAMLGTIFTFVIFLSFFTVNAGTEEYSLPFLMISLYIFTKYYFSPKQYIRFIELIVLGICFACAILIRLNMFPLWAGFCIVIFIETIIKRRFVQLGKHVLGFCLGTLVILIPVLIYLNSNGILNDFFDQVVFGGTSRGFSGGGLKDFVKNYYITMNRNFSFFPLAVGLFWIITKYRQPLFSFYLAYTFSYFLMVLFLSFSSGDSHYNVVIVPFIVPSFVFLVDILYSAFSGIKYKKTVLILFFCVLFSEGLLKYVFDITKIMHNNSGEQLKAAGKMIDENTQPDDVIISLGYNGYIYPFTQRHIASKYFYQGSGLNHIPNARDEFISDILTVKPAIIAMFTAENSRGQYMEGWHAPIYELIEKDYQLLSDKNGFNLYKIK